MDQSIHVGLWSMSFGSKKHVPPCKEWRFAL